MNLKCALGFHAWKGYKCSRCGRIREASPKPPDLRNSSAVGPLIATLTNGTENASAHPFHQRHGEWRECMTAAKALGEIGDPLAVEPLIEILVKSARFASADSSGLASDDKDMCAVAATALGRIGDARAVEPLAENLKRGRRVAIRATAVALGEIGDVRAVEALVESLGYADTDEAVAVALGKIGDVRAVVPLAQKLARCGLGAGSSESALSRALSDALVNFGASAVEPLIAAIQNLDIRNRHNKWALVWTLVKVGDARAIPTLVSALSDREWTVRKTAAEELVRLYSSGSLNSHESGLSLAQRGKITSPHIVRPAHENEWGAYVGAIHEGIGVDFPMT